MTENIVGRCLILDGRGVATLVGVDRWRVTIDGERSPGWEARLTARFAGRYAGPQDGRPGVAILRELAAEHGSFADICLPPGFDFPDIPN